MSVFVDGFQLPFAAKYLGNRFGVHDIVNGRDLYGAQGHRGVDFRVGAGARIPAIGNGEVAHVLWSDVLGNVTVVRHYIEGDGNDVYSGYAHQYAVLVRQGQEVRRGQVIGVSGATGSAAVGPHLHLTLSGEELGVISGEVRDPLGWIDAHPVRAASGKPAPIARYATARRGEGMIAIASRSGISFDRLCRLNPPKGPFFRAPDYMVPLGGRLRIA